MKMILLIFVVLFAWFAKHTFQVWKDSGADYIPKEIKPGHCRAITNIIGPEDMHLAGKILYISSNDNRMLGKNKVYERGNIFGLDLENGNTFVLNHDYKGDFHPHGIFHLNDESEGEFLFVANHKQEEDSILIFRIQDRNMNLYKEIKGKEVVNVNDIAAFDVNRFYFTRDHRFKTNLGKLLENFFRIGMGQLLFFDGKEIVPIRKDLKFANGLALDKTTFTLYVAEMLAKRIHKYSIVNLSNPEYLNNYEVPGAPDNLTLSRDSLYIASHNNILAIKQHQASADRQSPSTIYKMNLSSGKLKTIYSNSGEEISAASVAVPFGNKLYIGTIFDKKFLICENEVN